MTQSGGIIGLLHVIEISSDGYSKVSDERTGKMVVFNISMEGHQELDALIRATLKLTPLILNVNCADCFVYAIEISLPSRSARFELSDTQPADSGYEPLVAYLRKLMDAVLQ